MLYGECLVYLNNGVLGVIDFFVQEVNYCFDNVLL